MSSHKEMWPMHMGDLETMRRLVTAASELLEASANGKFDLDEPLFGILSAIGDKLNEAIKTVETAQEESRK